MNEQQLANLFSAQIDRMLSGETHVSTPVAELSELFNLSQQLSQVSFQPGPAAQLAFQTQLTGWFGSTGNGLTSTIFGIPKGLFMIGSAFIVAVGTGLALLMLFVGGTFTTSDEGSPVPVSPEVISTTPN